MLKPKEKKSPFEEFSEVEKIEYRQWVFNLSENILNDAEKVKKLIGYTLSEMKRFSKEPIINAREAEDFVQDTILKISEGKRFFGGSTEKDLFGFMLSIIPSIIYNEWKKTKVKLELNDEFGKRNVACDKYIPFNPAEDDEEILSDIVIKGTDTTILDKMILDETTKTANTYIIKELKKKRDSIGLHLFKAKKMGKSNYQKHVAKILQLPIKEVRNAAKRLERIINKAKRFQNEG